MNSIVFLEGPSFAGKTTFLRQAAGNVVRLPEASEFLGGDRYFPAAPVDAKTMAYCSYFFAVMENKRFELIGNAKNALILADRYTPLSSMIFYGLRHANGDIEDSEYELGKRLALDIFTRTINIPAGRGRFLRFDLSSKEVLAQRIARGTRNEELADWRAVEFYTSNYQAILPASTERVIDSVYEGELLEGTWIEMTELLKDVMSLTSDVSSSSPAISSDELENYLPLSTRQSIEDEIETLLRRKDSI